jgi:hypothetical protein
MEDVRCKMPDVRCQTGEVIFLTENVFRGNFGGLI